MTVDLAVDLGFVRLRNPIVLASGTAGHTDELSPYMDLSVPGAIITKGVSLKPRHGNPPPRIWESHGALLNSIGLENPGMERFLEHLPPLIEQADVVGVNIFGETLDEYGELVRHLAVVEGIDFFEINVSCPNVDKGGEEFGHDPRLVREITELCKRGAGSKGVVVKVPPVIRDLSVVEAALEGGADGVTVANTLPGAEVDLRNRRLVPGPRGRGGISGPALFPLTVNGVRMVREAFPQAVILASGGVTTAEDVIKLVMAGADAVQIGTLTFLDPAAGERLPSELPKILESLGATSITELRGAALPNG